MRNVLLISVDDVSPDRLAPYLSLSPGWNTAGEVSARQPNLTALAQAGLMYWHVGTSPTCSLSRYNSLCGRYGFRIGLGTVIDPGASQDVAGTREPWLPSLVQAHAPYPVELGHFGKWHLHTQAGLAQYGPGQVGFDHYRGSVANLTQSMNLDLGQAGGYAGALPPDAYGPGQGNQRPWEYVDNGGLELKQTYDATDYATTRVVEDAADWIGNQTDAWLAHVALHAPHSPYHQPPTNLHSFDVTANHGFGGTPPLSDEYDAMLEAVDTELAKLLESTQTGIRLSQQDFTAANGLETVVVFYSDNGSPGMWAAQPFQSSRGKATAYRYGTWVPMIVAGTPAQGHYHGLVHLVDLWATVLELFQINPGGVAKQVSDSVSFAHSFSPFAAGPTRSHIYTERFPDEHLPNVDTELGVRNGRYSIFRNVKQDTTEMYDLLLDPGETTNLLAGAMSQEARGAYAALSSKLLEYETVHRWGAPNPEAQISQVD